MAAVTQIENRPVVGWCEVTYEESAVKKVDALVPVLLSVVKEALSQALMHPSVLNATTLNGMAEAIHAQSTALTNVIVTQLRTKGFVKEHV
jgi:hypothetical protein